MLNVEDSAEIRRSRSEQLPIFEIARVLGIARNTVKAALASDSPPKYQRAPTGSVVDGAGQSSPDASRMYWPLPARPLPTAAAAANSLNGARPGSNADGAKVAAATASGPMLFLNVIADGALAVAVRECAGACDHLGVRRATAPRCGSRGDAP